VKQGRIRKKQLMRGQVEKERSSHSREKDLEVPRIILKRSGRGGRGQVQETQRSGVKKGERLRHKEGDYSEIYQPAKNSRNRLKG